jgi:hypothetical protein
VSQYEPVVWEDPPAPRTGAKGAWVERLEPLMAQPGEWANLGRWSQSTASCLRRGVLRTPPGRWEFTVRHSHASKTGGRKAILYARYLGPSEEK